MAWNSENRLLPPVVGATPELVRRISRDLAMANYHRLSSAEIDALVPLLERFNTIPSYAPNDIVQRLHGALPR